MLAYVVRRTSNEEAGPTLYHLFDATADLLFVAQPGQPDPRDAAPLHRHIYFRAPDGRIVASLDLPWADPAREGPPQYALIHDDAVYALLTGSTSTDESKPFRLCSVEVEGKRWIGLRPTTGEGPLLSLYEDVDSDLSIYGTLEPDDLPDPVAVVSLAAGTNVEDGIFLVEIAQGRLIQPGLLALALVLLVDRRGT